MRNVPTDLITALNQSTCSPYYAVEFLTDDNDNTRWDQVGYTGENALRFWTGIGSRTINSETYQGAGGLLAINGLRESAELRANGATITLSGIDTSIMSLVLQEPYQGRRVNVYLGGDGVTSTVRVFAGIADTMPIKHSAESVQISLTVEHKIVGLQKANVRRYTSENHKLRHPTDTAFDWVISLQDKEIAWGRNTD